MTLRIPSPEIPIITVPSSSHRIQRFIFPLVFSALVTGLGVAFGIHALIAGHDHVFGTSREVPWGILVTPYVFFACLATGACILSSLGQIFRVTPFVPLVKQTVYISRIVCHRPRSRITMEGSRVRDHLSESFVKYLVEECHLYAVSSIDDR